MTVPAVEDFAGTGALSANWTPQSNPIFAACSRSADLGKGDAIGDYCLVYWNFDSFGNSQSSEVTINSGLLIDEDFVLVLVRSAGTDAGASKSGYFFMTDGDGATGVHTCYGYWLGNAQFFLGEFPATFVSGDKIKIEAEGTTIRFKQNGAVMGEITDATLISGQPGWGAFGDGARVDNWIGDTIPDPLLQALGPQRTRDPLAIR